MQAIARVNRVYKGKEGGLVVDYIGIAGGAQTSNEGLHQPRQKQLWKHGYCSNGLSKVSGKARSMSRYPLWL